MKAPISIKPKPCPHCGSYGYKWNDSTRQAELCSICDGTGAMPMWGAATKREEYRQRIVRMLLECGEMSPYQIAVNTGIYQPRVEREILVLLERRWIVEEPSVGFAAGIGIIRYRVTPKEIAS